MIDTSVDLRRVFGNREVKELKLFYIRGSVTTRTTISPKDLQEHYTDVVVKVNPRVDNPLVSSFLDSINTKVEHRSNAPIDVRFGLVVISRTDQVLYSLFSSVDGNRIIVNDVQFTSPKPLSSWILRTWKSLLIE